MNNNDYNSKKFQINQKKYPTNLFDRQLEKSAGFRRDITSSNYDPCLLSDVKQSIRELDIKQHNRRFEWYDLPEEINGDLVERLLYLKGQLCLFFYEPLNKFYILPYALSGTIDAYGQYNEVRPVVMGSGQDNKDPDDSVQYIDPTMSLTVIKDVLPDEVLDNMTYDDIVKSCVILRDRPLSNYSQTTTPRYFAIDKIIEMEAEQMVWSRTAAMNSVGTVGVKCDSTTSNEVIKLNSQLYSASVSGDKFVPVQSTLSDKSSIDTLDASPSMKPQEFLQTFQSYDNYRLMTLGLENGGVFEKQGTILQSEANLNSNNTYGVLMDDLRIRQQFCIIANQLFGLQLWCDLAVPQDAFEQPEDMTGRDNMIDNDEPEAPTDTDNGGGGDNVNSDK